MVRFHSKNPATGEIIWEGESASKESIDKAIQMAQEAFKTWVSLSLNERLKYLEKFQQIVSKNLNSFAEAISKETGKPLWDSKGEISAIINKLPISIEAYQKRCAEMAKNQPSGTSITRHKPHGIVAVFGPYNFPAHLPNGHIMPALIAGNTVILKPSNYTPGVAELMMHYWQEAELPKGVINLVQGGAETGDYLAKHPGLNGLFFTGSWRVGKLLLEHYSKHPEKILALEMGGNNPLVIHEISNLKAAAYLTVQSAYLTSGQRCTCARRLIITNGNLSDAFITELISQIKLIKSGSYTDQPEPFMGPVISEEAAHHLLNVQLSLAQNKGIPLIEMRQIKSGTGILSPGLMDVTDVPNRQDEEYFGPFLQIIRVDNFDNAIKEANNTAYGLTAGLFSDKNENYEKFLNSAKAGVINWNTQLTGASSAAPFGGIGHSGNFRPSAYYAADYCSYPVASLESSELKLPSTLPPGIGINESKLL